MASLLYNSFLDDLSKGNIDGDTDTFFVMLVTSTYAPDKDAHNRRDDVTNEVAGTGYTAGGKVSAVTLSQDNANDREEWAFGDVVWTVATITARAAVIYKHRGGASSADELVAYVDFGADRSVTGGTFTFHTTSNLRFQN